MIFFYIDLFDTDIFTFTKSRNVRCTRLFDTQDFSSAKNQQGQKK